MDEARRNLSLIAAGCLTGFAALAAYLGWLGAGQRPAVAGDQPQSAASGG